MTAAKKLDKSWWKGHAKETEDLDRIRPKARSSLALVPEVSEMIPPFRGLSRELLTMPQAAIRLKVSLTTIKARIRERLIFTHPRGRRVYIPAEECENYSERERLQAMRRNG